MDTDPIGTPRRGPGGNGYVVSRNLHPRLVPVASCKPPPGRETRKHPPRQVRKLAASLDRFGIVLPILIDRNGRVVAGWGLILAAKQLGLTEVPAVTITDLSEADLRLLRLALNRISEDAAWDREQLTLEFSEILKLEPHAELEISGFDLTEIDLSPDVDERDELDPSGRDEEDALTLVKTAAPAVTRFGDLWILGDHRLLCGEPLQGESYLRLLGNAKSDIVFADLQNAANSVSELEAASAADSSAESERLEAFLKSALGHAACWSRDGAIHFVCTEWRHLPEVLAAGREIYGSFENLCVWIRSDQGRAAPSSLYRPRHELVCVFKVGQAAPISNLGRRRHRTDIWDYASPKGLNLNSKPVALIADAIRDCSNRGGVIVDLFGGAGTTLIAAERTRRRARVIERDPILVDFSIERWQQLTGCNARHAESGQPFMRNRNTKAMQKERAQSPDK